MVTHNAPRPFCVLAPGAVPQPTTRPPLPPTRSPEARLRWLSAPLARPTYLTSYMSRVDPDLANYTRDPQDTGSRGYSTQPPASYVFSFCSHIPSSHDSGYNFLFDPSLQFCPTSGRKKREFTKKHWQAVQIEVDTGCVCTSFDERGRRLPCVCQSSASSSSRPPSSSCIPPLVNKLCQVLHSVVHSATADAALIAQELRHDVFDSRGVFRTLGAVLKQNCAPMCDRVVKMVVTVAARHGGGVCAVRMSLEILKLMKLHIANRQLQALRPYLPKTAVEFELKMFQERHKRGLLTLTTTQVSLRKATLTVPSTSTLPLLSHVLTGLVIFPPPTKVSTPLPPTTTPLSQRLPHITPLPGYPETLYLDHTRLAGLTANTANLGVLYMLLMLCRQLVFSNPSGPRPEKN
ncbi:hypothetical protein FRC12_001560 [Ceratobasidium sp. 428]|nr:hypothetical protein FRC12_001560 [Ceratobasidium sp. 428]